MHIQDINGMSFLDIPTCDIFVYPEMRSVVNQPPFETVWGNHPKVCVHHPKHGGKGCSNIDIAQVRGAQYCDLLGFAG